MALEGVPVTELLNVERGVTFRCKITLYEDKAKTKPLNLTGLIVTLAIQGAFSLTAGAGLTITPLAGEIAVKLTPAQIASVSVPQTSYRLTLEESPEEIVAVLKGPIHFT
jgi:hypothetical protein